MKLFRCDFVDHRVFVCICVRTKQRGKSGDLKALVGRKLVTWHELRAELDLARG